MNAYELADEFKNRNWDEVDCVLWCEKAVNMLRQQADRIAELEKKSEPVAWMNPTGLEYKQRASDFMYNDALYDKKLDWIPLYTTPQTKPLNQQTLECPSYLHNFAPQTKPLSNEEMVSEWDLISYDPKTYTWTDKCSNDLIIRFGRAIEAKVRGQ